MGRVTPFLRPIAFSEEALNLYHNRPKEASLAIYYKEIQPNTCCGIAVDVRPVWEKQSLLKADPDYIALESQEGIPIYLHRALAVFLRQHPIRIVAKGWGRFKWLRLESDTDIEKWCIFGEEAF